MRNRLEIKLLRLSVFLIVILVGCSNLRWKVDVESESQKELISAFYKERQAWDFVESDSIWIELQSKDSLLIMELIENRGFYSKNNWIWFSRNKNFI